MDENEISTQVVAVVGDVTALRVVDAPSYSMAGELLKKIAGMKKTIKTYFEPLKTTAKASHQAIVDKEKGELLKLDPADAHLRKQIGIYQEQIEAARRAEQARLDAERFAAEKKAREEAEAAAKAAQEAEQARLDAEREIAEKAAREKAEANAKAAAEKAALEAHNAAVLAALEAGNLDAAKEAMAAPVEAVPVAAPVFVPPPRVLAAAVTPVYVPPPPMVKAEIEPPKIDGLSGRKVWKFRVTDAGKVPREYMSVDKTKIMAAVVIGKGETKIPGVEVYQETIQNVRGVC